MDEEDKKVSSAFAGMVMNYYRYGAGNCEFIGHYDESSPEHDAHDTEGPKWREWFVCPTCGDDAYLLVCQAAHEQIVKWADTEYCKLNFFDCGPCATSWEFLDVYNGGFAWG